MNKNVKIDNSTVMFTVQGSVTLTLGYTSLVCPSEQPVKNPK